MKKILLFLLVSLILVFSLSSSPIVYGLDSSFNLSYLIFNNYNLELNEEDNSILITPPKSKTSEAEKDIDSFEIFTLDSSDDWQFGFVTFKENVPYSSAYSYIKQNYGEGASKENTVYFINKYSSEPSQSYIISNLLNGNLEKYFLNYMISTIVITLSEFQEIDNLNMWQTEDLCIISISFPDEAPVILYVNSEPIINFMVENIVQELMNTLNI